MQSRTWFALLWSLGLVTAACQEDRPLYTSMSPSGAAGTGNAGTGGPAGSGGPGGTGVPPGPTPVCVTQIVQSHLCTTAGACHDAMGSAANFDLATPGWEARLVGVYPKGGGAGALMSMCNTSNVPYLVPGSMPATGLLLDKLKNKTPICGTHMPSFPPDLTATELTCLQTWANALTVAVPAQPPASCDRAPQLFATYNCAVNGACHDRNGTAAGLDLSPPGNGTPSWEQRLIGKLPSGGGQIASMCGATRIPYLVTGSVPAQGLLLDKLTQTNPPCGAQMPALPPIMTPADLACLKDWATTLTAKAVAETCPLACASGQYCRLTYSSDGGVSPVPISGAWACFDTPPVCNTAPTCDCLKAAGCYSCERLSDHFRCRGV